MITFTTLTLARETIINVFFQSIRENITPSLPHDEEILLVPQWMLEVLDFDEDTNAAILSEYLGATV
tara:strand:+ start:333 stop:533 length:201 start_codon:yes stop_codon:yes gene_type:complete